MEEMKNLAAHVESMEAAVGDSVREALAAKATARFWRCLTGGLLLCTVMALSVQRGTTQSNNSLEARVTSLETLVANLQTALNAESTAWRQGDVETLNAAKSFATAGDAAIELEVSKLKTKTSGITGDSTKLTIDLSTQFDVRVAGKSVFSIQPGAMTYVSPDQGTFAVAGNDAFFDRINLSILNGSGSTPNKNGLGNLIIGYNEPRNDGSDSRTGSHCVIVGNANNYSSYGGIVVGLGNTISAPYSSVSGGWGNRATGEYASVSGGVFGLADGWASSVTCGQNNRASGPVSSVSGGAYGWAEGWGSAVVGGQNNRASYAVSTVSGGYLNWSDGWGSAIGGGYSNRASADVSTVSGGASRSVTSWGNWRAGTLSSAP